MAITMYEMARDAGLMVKGDPQAFVEPYGFRLGGISFIGSGGAFSSARMTAVEFLVGNLDRISHADVIARAELG
jgi:hypothetical protein